MRSFSNLDKTSIKTSTDPERSEVLRAKVEVPVIERRDVPQALTVEAVKKDASNDSPVRPLLFAPPKGDPFKYDNGNPRVRRNVWGPLFLYFIVICGSALIFLQFLSLGAEAITGLIATALAFLSLFMFYKLIEYASKARVRKMIH